MTMDVKKKFEPDVCDELLDIVDEQDRVIGTLMRSEVSRAGSSNYRAVTAIITNPEGRLLIARRAHHKKSAPGALHCVGGCVRSGESYEQALVREIKEEITLDLNSHPYQYLGKLSPQKDQSACHIAIYKIELNHEIELVFNEDDFSDIYWLFPQELYDKIKQGEKTLKNLPILLKKFILN